MDFRIYIYKINKIMNQLIVKKIINFLFLAALIVTLLLTSPFCTQWLKIQPLFLKTYKLFDFSVKTNLIYSAIWIGVASIWFFIWISCIIDSSKISTNIQDATEDKMTRANSLTISNLLDLVGFGWIVVIACKKNIIMNAYNYGVDNWLNYSEY